MFSYSKRIYKNVILTDNLLIQCKGNEKFYQFGNFFFGKTYHCNSVLCEDTTGLEMP